MSERLAIIDGIRTPFCRAGGVFQHYEADDLGAFVLRELMTRINVPVDEVVFGNVIEPPHATNVARVVAAKGGLPFTVPSGTRLVLTLLRELRRQGKNVGLATLCVGGGQGQSAIVEVT